MILADPRFERERRTMEVMILIFCRDRHDRRGGLCDHCGRVLVYAEQRLDRCLFPGNKPTCAACPVHCYRPDMRAEVKEIMRYAGPRMMYRHPYLAIRHMLDGWSRGPFVRRPPVPAASCAPTPSAADERRAAVHEADAIDR